MWLFAALAACAFCAAESDADARAASSAALVAEGWKHCVWALYPIEKLKADEAPVSRGPCMRVSLSAARGEAEPFVVVVRSEVPLRHAEVLGADLRGPGGAALSAACIRVQRLGYIHVDEPSGARIKQPMPYETGTGDFPDPLLLGGGDARPGRNLQFLVSVQVPRDAKPGVYEGALRLRFEREGWMPAGIGPEDALPLSVAVRGFALPEISPLANTCVASPQALPLWLRNDGTLRALRRDCVAHGQAPDPLPSPVVAVDTKGALAVDASAWERAASELLDVQHVSHLFLPVWSHDKDVGLQGVYFLWHYPAVCKQRWFGATVCDATGDLTPEFKARFGAYLVHMQAIVARHGWQGRIYVTTMDEPYTYHLHDADRVQDTPENNARVIAGFARLVREAAPGLKTFATADPTPALAGSIDHWCLRNLDHAAAARERAERFGETVTFCDNYRTFIDYPAVSARSLGWLAWKIGARGWLTYETLGDFSRAWEGPAFVYPVFSGGTVWGMGQLFYPDPAGSGRVAPSLRWELMREGCDDYAYLWLLRDAVQRLPAAERDSPLAREARTLLDSAAGTVVGGPGDAETTPSSAAPNAQSNRVPHDLRQRIGGLIERLDRCEIQPTGKVE